MKEVAENRRREAFDLQQLLHLETLHLGQRQGIGLGVE